MSEIAYRWVDGVDATDTEWNAIDAKLAARGWMSLNRLTSRILMADRSGEIVGLYCLQLIPHVEPMLVDRREWGSGVAEELANRMQNYLVESRARGFMAICESPIAAKMCEERGMVKTHFPVYVSVPEGG